MAIKAGDLAASAPGKSQTMISDGKRMRVMWEEGDGNGDASTYLIERTQSTIKGHPTWKVFCGDVADPIIRGKNEPPRYVYLDDKACYAVWSSQLYSKQELKGFWPFDFDHVGKIKSGRKNRGRPAYLDDSCTEYAHGTLRNKNKVYEFCGAPDFIGYMPEPSSEGDAGGGDIKEEPTTNNLTTPIIPTLTFPLSPLWSPIANSSATTHPSRPTQGSDRCTQERGLGNGRVAWEPTESRRYIAGPADGSLLPLGMAHKAMQGSPYFEEPAATFRTNPRPRGGDLAGILGVLGVKRKAKVIEKTKDESLPALKKRKVTRPFASSSSDGAAATPPTECTKVDDEFDELEPRGAPVEK